MARPRKTIPRIIGIDMIELASKLLMMTDEESGRWLKKAVNYCINGCTSPDCDKFIEVQFRNSVIEMNRKQDHDARTYKNRLERQGKTLSSGKPDRTISANDAAAVATTPSAGGSCTNSLATTPCTEISANKTSKEGGDTREGSLNIPDSDALKGVSTAGGSLESGTPSLLPFTVTTPQKTLAVETPEDGLRKAKGAQVSLSCAATASDAEQARSDAAAKRPYGTCGHVMLTDAEGRHLREVYGPDLITAIDILDAYIENNGKAAKRYKNHAAVLRKGNWVWNKILELHRNEKLLENADRRAKSFKEIDRERETKAMHSSIFAPSITTEQTKRSANV